MKVAFIPARGGSKRIPGKNLRLFNGQPLISYALEAVHQSAIFDQVIISTDSQDVLEFGRQADVTVIERQAELADDFSTIREVVRDFITKSQLQLLDSVCCVLPSNPFLIASDLKKADEMHHQWEFVYAIMESQKPVERALTRLEDGTTKMRLGEFQDTRTQDLPKSFFDAGQFYFASVQSWLSSSSILNSRSLGLIASFKNSIDIDTIEDWKLAESIFEKYFGAQK